MYPKLSNGNIHSTAFTTRSAARTASRASPDWRSCISVKREKYGIISHSVKPARVHNVAIVLYDKMHRLKLTADKFRTSA